MNASQGKGPMHLLAFTQDGAQAANSGNHTVDAGGLGVKEVGDAALLQLVGKADPQVSNLRLIDERKRAGTSQLAEIDY